MNGQKRALWLTEEEAEELQKMVDHVMATTSYPLEPDLFKLHARIDDKLKDLRTSFDSPNISAVRL